MRDRSPYGFEYFNFGSRLYSRLEGNLTKEQVSLEQSNLDLSAEKAAGVSNEALDYKDPPSC